MGQRISYFKNNFNKGLTELIVENYSNFRKWYLDMVISSKEEFNEPFGNEDLKTYFKKETEFITDFSNLNKQIIDELTADFIAHYCDSTDIGGKILELFGPTMSKWRYDLSNEMVLATQDNEFIRIWNYVIKGRSLKDNDGFKSYTNDFKIGFLNREEYLVLKSKIENHFGDTEAMRLKYWTISEKTQHEEASKNSNGGSYLHSKHNPKTSGLEYMLDALNELTDKNRFLLTGIA